MINIFNMPLQAKNRHIIYNNHKQNNQKDYKDYVVIVHGILGSDLYMATLANYLTKHNYDVININYPSSKYQLDKLTELIYNQLKTKLTQNKPVHFVGHSMGGLLIRALINKHRPKNLGRVVQLGTPNHGSEIVNVLKNNILFKKMYGPAGQELAINDHQRDKLLGDVNYELGGIAGTMSFNPFGHWFIPGKNDGDVSVKSTYVTGMKDHLVLPIGHPFFPFSLTVKKQVLYFLKHGHFSRLHQ